MSSGESIVSRVRAGGVHAATPLELMAIAFARREGDVAECEQPAREFLRRFGGIQGISDMSSADLAAATGLEDFEVLRTLAMIELGRRSQGAGRGEILTIDSPEDAMELLKWMKREKREHFVAILLDAKNQIMRVATIHIGTLTMSVVGAREVFREAIRDGASSLIVAHNHPSGDPTPSPEDIEITKSLIQIGELLDIPVLDHVIIGDRRAISLRNQGYVR